MPDLTQLAQLCDDLAGEPVLVVGSPPADARDLDLLVRPSAVAALEAGLAEAGLAGVAGTWARFADCRAEVVDLLPAYQWGLPPAVVDDLFAAARPLCPYRRLMQPAPHHTLLIVAWRTGGDPSLLTTRRYARIERALQDDPNAWEAARAAAAAWSLVDAVNELEQRWAGAAPADQPAPAPEDQRADRPRT